MDKIDEFFEREQKRLNRPGFRLEFIGVGDNFDPSIFEEEDKEGNILKRIFNKIFGK